LFKYPFALGGIGVGFQALRELFHEETAGLVRYISIRSTVIRGIWRRNPFGPKDSRYGIAD
jgi:hypothetical protein